MSTTGPVKPGAAGSPPGRGLAVLARAPFAARALRELLFCAIEVPLGLCVLAFPIALAGLPLLVALLVHGASPSARPVEPHPAGVVAVFGGVIIFALLALLFLTPRIARGLGAVHRRLAARLLG